MGRGVSARGRSSSTDIRARNRDICVGISASIVCENSSGFSLYSLQRRVAAVLCSRDRIVLTLDWRSAFAQTYESNRAELCLRSRWGESSIHFRDAHMLEQSLAHRSTTLYTFPRTHAHSRLLQFRGPRESAGFRLSDASTSFYIAYLDEFGHIGPFVSRSHRSTTPARYSVSAGSCSLHRRFARSAPTSIG